VGALLLVLGGILLSIEKEEDEDGETSHTFDWKTFGLMAGSVFIVALIYVWFKDVTEDETRYAAVGFWSGFGMFLSGAAIWLVFSPYRRDFSPYRRDFNEFAKNVDSKVHKNCARLTSGRALFFFIYIQFSRQIIHTDCFIKMFQMQQFVAHDSL
jgi:hypothetical protein